LRTESVGESVQFHRMKFVDGLLIQHMSFLSSLSRHYCTSLVGGS
jgi:hypothetical protein